LLGGGAVVLVAALVVLSVPYRRARRARHDVNSLALALNVFVMENKRFPDGTPAEVARLLRGEDVRGQNPRRLDYIEAGPHEYNAAGEFVDPWGTAYRLVMKLPVRVYSCGPNRRDEDGGGDDIEGR
jgi:hypothetical protein